MFKILLFPSRIPESAGSFVSSHGHVHSSGQCGEESLLGKFPFQKFNFRITKANPWEDHLLLFVLNCSLIHSSRLGQQCIPGGGAAVIFDEITQYGR